MASRLSNSPCWGQETGNTHSSGRDFSFRERQATAPARNVGPAIISCNRWETDKHSCPGTQGQAADWQDFLSETGDRRQEPCHKQ